MMRKFLIMLNVLFLMFSVNVNTQAQPPERGERPSAEEMVERMLTDLGKAITLTEKEKTALKEIFTDFHTQMDKMHESGSRPDRSVMEKMEEERDAKVKEILPEVKYKAYTNFMKEHMKPTHGGQGGPPPPRD